MEKTYSEPIFDVIDIEESNKVFSANSGGGEVCLAAGTKITMADGSVKNIEDIVEGDEVRTFDHEAGVPSSSKICLIANDGNKDLPLSLNFSSGKSLTFIGTHDLLEETSRKYVRVNYHNVKSFVGKNYYNAEAGTWDKLESYIIGTKPEPSYYIVSAHHLNCIANGMLTVGDDIDFLLNIYKLDADLKADPEQLAADIAEYGLYDVTKEIPEYPQFHEVLNKLGAKYAYILLGKGLVPPNYIETMKSYWLNKE